MARCTSAFYGKGKALRDESWQAIGADIDRRILCGDLAVNLHFLSFANRPITAEGWRVIADVLSKLKSCWTLDLQKCNINDMTKLVRLIPTLVNVTRRINLAGNHLTAKSVQKLVGIMTTSYAGVRPSWLCIGEDAESTANVHVKSLPCHPYHERGCLCKAASVVHVTRNLPKFNVKDKMSWEEKHLAPLRPYLRTQSLTSTASATATNSPVSSVDSPSLSTSPMDLPTPTATEVASTFADLVAALTPLPTPREEVLLGFPRLGNPICVEGRQLMIAASANDRLLVVDLTTSLHRGSVVDVHGSPVFGSRPLYDSASRTKALPFAEARADQHELFTEGGETLEINFDKPNLVYLLDGWVAARVVDTTVFSWFPVDRCMCV